MKSNISQKEIASGKKIVDILSLSNPQLLPNLLKKDIPKYQSFSNTGKYELWSSTKSKFKNTKKYDKIIMLTSGLAASGKDSIYSEMVKLYPDLFFKTITATSRPIRDGEVDKTDYFFIKTVKKFKKAIKNQEFLEFIKRGDNYYGLPKISLDRAIDQSNPVIYCQIEMSGWSKLTKYIASLKNKKILIIKAFILPDMSFLEYISWLKEKRANEDLDSRINKTGWEIKKAPVKSDFIIINQIRNDISTLTSTAQTIIDQLLDFLPN